MRRARRLTTCGECDRIGNCWKVQGILCAVNMRPAVKCESIIGRPMLQFLILCCCLCVAGSKRVQTDDILSVCADTPYVRAYRAQRH